MVLVTAIDDPVEFGYIHPVGRTYWCLGCGMTKPSWAKAHVASTRSRPPLRGPNLVRVLRIIGGSHCNCQFCMMWLVRVLVVGQQSKEAHLVTEVWLRRGKLHVCRIRLFTSGCLERSTLCHILKELLISCSCSEVCEKGHLCQRIYLHDSHKTYPRTNAFYVLPSGVSMPMLYNANQVPIETCPPT
jgi:hypothetical protein